MHRRQLFKWWHRVRDGTLTRLGFQRKVKPLRAEVADLLRQAEVCTEQSSKLAGMAKKILEVEVSMWTFVEHPGVEPTNNAAERALRHAVIWRKTSFGTQSTRNGLRRTHADRGDQPASPRPKRLRIPRRGEHRRAHWRCAAVPLA